MGDEQVDVFVAGLWVLLKQGLVYLTTTYGLQFLLAVVVSWYIKRLARKWITGYYFAKLRERHKPWFFYGLLDTIALLVGGLVGALSHGDLSMLEGFWAGTAGGALMGTVASLAHAVLAKLRARAGIQTADLETTSGDITLEPFPAIRDEKISEPTIIPSDPAEKITDKPGGSDGT